MTRSIHRRLIQAVLAAFLLSGAVAPPAFAQDEQQSLEPRSSHRTRLDGICGEALARFCPALADSPGRIASQVTCLKPYRTSLPLSCRRAVTAALK